MAPTFTHLVMSGGGMTSLCYLGALRFLDVEGMTKKIKHIAGTSMGALFAAALALQIPLDHLEDRVARMLDDDAAMSMPIPDVFAYVRDLGVEDPRRFVEILRPEIDMLTFLELSKKTGVNLVICATHVATMDAMYFSVDTTPNVLVMDAVRASIAVPWLFKPVKIGDDYFVDGGVADNLPFRVFEDIPSSAVLLFHTYPKMLHMPEHKNPSDKPISYTLCLISRFLSQLSGAAFIREKYPYYLFFDSAPLSFMPVILHNDRVRINVKKGELDESISYGYSLAFNNLRKFMQESEQTP